ncbi:MAG: thiol-disulfide oxidoreductase [Flavobacteriaceae bacterium]|nr:thiol-disulfide oxidoreductase [Flavobacteriaceae bacterium]
MGKLLLTLFLLATLPMLSQDREHKEFFSDAIGKNIRKYRINSRIAYIRKDEERAQFLFDSLINNVVRNTYIDNFKVRKFSGRKIELYDFEKPIYLITYATWCTPGIGEIPALNDIADNYHEEIDFVMLFWGSKKRIRKMKRELSHKIKILYVDEKENRSDFIIRCMKHSLGFPTSFFIDKDKKIVDVRRTFLHHYSEDYTTSYNNNYQTYTSGVSLLKKDTIAK